MNLNIGDTVFIKRDVDLTEINISQHYKIGDEFMLIELGFHCGRGYYINGYKLKSLSGQIICISNEELNLNFETLIDKRNRKIDSILWE